MGIKEKPLRDDDPTGDVILISPVVPESTIACIYVGDSTLKEAAAVPPKLTSVTFDKLLPFIITVSFFEAASGVNELITGGGMKE